MTVVYLDAFLVLNFGVNYLLCWPALAGWTGAPVPVAGGPGRRVGGRVCRP